ncbi:Serine/threonine-protein kinase pim-2 [Anabarilius grahami]|uniref:non-specific serine/threonine protein kinase n=1 Tax=Anabarilius grahami TaxID=495550 RepID=A0A3N0YJP0_ANAGA|nr:Serine/threonine-protein kinase pim-2 [Anabarilius grahami]
MAQMCWSPDVLEYKPTDGTDVLESRCAGVQANRWHRCAGVQMCWSTSQQMAQMCWSTSQQMAQMCWSPDVLEYKPTDGTDVLEYKPTNGTDVLEYKPTDGWTASGLVTTADHYNMVLQRPCQSLQGFLQSCPGITGENLARVIMQQATFAAQICCQRGVFHRDIKLENLLINPETLEVKLIDFDMLENKTTDVTDTPEYKLTATEWSLGVLLFVMVCEDFPRSSDLDKILKKNIVTKDGLSQECCDFIGCCLRLDPKEQIELDSVILHNWFKKSITF